MTREAPVVGLDRSARLSRDYYLDHFHQVIDGVRDRYGSLLNAGEISHLETIEQLDAPARRLYARLVNRRGPYFRLGRLSYWDIGSIKEAAGSLISAKLLQICNAPNERADQLKILACFTHEEIVTALQGRGVPRHRRRGETLNWLEAWADCHTWLATLLTLDPVIRIPAGDPWNFLRFLFFGDLRDNLSDFVTDALGYVIVERVAPHHLAPKFTARAEVDDAYRMATFYAEFRQSRDIQPALDTLAWWDALGIERGKLAAGVEWFDRLIGHLGRRLERENCSQDAMRLYATSPVAPARERLARLILKAGDEGRALTLLHVMRDQPSSSEEAYVARQIMARIQAPQVSTEARQLQRQGQTIVIEHASASVEADVLAHYRSKGWDGVHSENWLLNASFALLLWDIIYDPAAGRFHSPLQIAPSDLHDVSFYATRQEAIERRLLLLDDRAACITLMRRHYEEKSSIANPFINWRVDIWPVVETLVNRLPPDGHAAALRHLATDIRHHARGLPDLFLWKGESAYRFVEVKSENDQLASHQYEWIRVLQRAGIHTMLVNVKRNRALPGGMKALGK